MCIRDSDYTGRDLLFFEPATNKWTHYFDGAALAGFGTSVIIDAFQIDGSLPPASLPCSQCAPIVMSFSAPVQMTVDGVSQSIGPSDLVRFSPTAVSAANVITAGAFTLERTAAAMGLPAAANIDALDRTPDGRQLMSFAEDLALGGQTFSNEDLIAYAPVANTWTLFLDGNQIPYNPFSDDLTAAWLDRDGHLYISGDPVGGSAVIFVFVTNSTARGNVVYNNYGEGLVAGRFSTAITLEDNVSYDNDHANLYVNSAAYPVVPVSYTHLDVYKRQSYDNRGANIYLVNTTNVTVRRNFVFCTNDPISWRGTGGQYRPGPGLQVRDEDFKTPPPPSTGQVIVNNIVVGCGVNFGVSTQINGGGLNNAVVANNTFVNARSVSGDAANNVEFDGRASFQNTRFRCV